MVNSKTIVYIGNKMGRHGLTPGTIELLSEKLAESFTIISASEKKNPVLRLLDMCKCIFQNRHHADYVLIDTYSTSAFYFAWACGMVCQLFNLKYIPILHGGYLPKRLMRNPILASQLFNNAYKLVAPSGYMKQRFEMEEYRHIEIIPNFIRPESYPYKHRTKILPKLLWVRSFHHTYNPEMAIQALALLHQKGIAASLCMIGPDKDGSLQICKKLANSLGLSEHIEFTGRLTKEMWIERSASFDIFLNTTHVDNTPVSVIEAMALGMCIVSTNVGGVPFILSDGINAKLVDDGDIEGMCNAIMHYLKNPEITSMYSSAARIQAELWSWTNVKPLWLKLLS
jgi:glycosyltransferase involved in cell wall biosynthesis